LWGAQKTVSTGLSVTFTGLKDVWPAAASWLVRVASAVVKLSAVKVNP
jgi:hypothetical protein